MFHIGFIKYLERKLLFEKRMLCSHMQKCVMNKNNLSIRIYFKIKNFKMIFLSCHSSVRKSVDAIMEVPTSRKD